jgi:predicted metalloprotease with PDZ domain
MIRQLSKGTKSLDDFCRSFHGGASGQPALKSFEFADVVAGLNAVQPYDWATFLNQRLQSTSPRAPLGGIEMGGWKLAYTAERSEFWKADEESRKLVDLSYSLGVKVKEDGEIIDVAYNGPAHKAGVAPSVRLIAVNGRQFTPTVLREAVKRTAGNGTPVELLIKNGEFYQSHRIEYGGGERYPQLVRQEGVPDLLTPLISSRSAR